MKIALIQNPISTDKSANLALAAASIDEAAANGAGLIVLPEMFACPYSSKWFRVFAEDKSGPTYAMLSEAAAHNHIGLIGGSFPELEDGRYYNTSFVFDPTGRETACHRKIHLFDIDVKGGQYFKESDTFTPGENITVFQLLGHTFGLAICFDIRFPELFRCMTLMGAEAVFVPASFNMTTGPMHWEISFRMRAVDNQYFTIGCAPARQEDGHYVSYGNSIVCDPWGRVIARAGAEACILYADLDLAENDRVREQLPLLKARRPVLYHDCEARCDNGIPAVT